MIAMNNYVTAENNAHVYTLDNEVHVWVRILFVVVEVDQHEICAKLLWILFMAAWARFLGQFGPPGRSLRFWSTVLAPRFGGPKLATEVWHPSKNELKMEGPDLRRKFLGTLIDFQSPVFVADFWAPSVQLRFEQILASLLTQALAKFSPWTNDCRDTT